MTTVFYYFTHIISDMGKTHCTQTDFSQYSQM
jgi:hypothetical protein